jgi:hypothetical protein
VQESDGILSSVCAVFLGGAKGGLYGWEQVRGYPQVILVEFDYVVLWQAGFHNVTCSRGTHLNACQFRQLCDGPPTVYLALDAGTNSNGQQAAQRLARRLREHGLNARRVWLPEGYDPNSFFVLGIGEAADLSHDCLHATSPDHWAIHVSKLKTERMVPVDSFVCELVQRLRFFRSFDPCPPERRQTSG